MSSLGNFQACNGIFFRCYIHLGESTANFLGDFVAEVFIQVPQGNLNAIGRQFAGSGCTQAGCTAGDDG